jgi:hypothetical protein
MNNILSWTSVEGVYKIFKMSKHRIKYLYVYSQKDNIKVVPHQRIKWQTSIGVSLCSAAATSVSMFKAAPNPVL